MESKIKITAQLISIPPHISTTWDHVKSLQVDKDERTGMQILRITLQDSSRIAIPGLPQEILDRAFAEHIHYIEKGTNILPAPSPPPAAGLFGPNQVIGIPLGFGPSGALEGLGDALQHNPTQSESPDLPAEVIEKIRGIATMMGNDPSVVLPTPEANCNCLHCQIARAIQKGLGKQFEGAVPEEELVSDEELRFRTWDIHQISEKVYAVNNPLEQGEHYSVFLGDPIGCTCGHKNCEHIQAVLRS